MQQVILQSFRLAIVGAIVLSLLGYFGHWHPYLELTAHFKLQYWVVSLCAYIFFSLTRQVAWSLMSGACLLLNLSVILPWYFPAPAPAATQSLRVLSANVLIRNVNLEPLIKLIQQEDPDLVIVSEINQRWLNALKVTQPRLPYQLTSPDAIGYGMAIFSKYPLVPEFPKSLSGLDREMQNDQILATLLKDTQAIRVIALHPPPPRDLKRAAQRNRHLSAIAHHIQTLELPTIAVGDFNITMWSPIYRDFEQTADLHNSRQGFGILPTWTTRFPLLLIPIDHCLVSSEIQVLNMRVGQNIGSDHLPILIDLAL